MKKYSLIALLFILATGVYILAQYHSYYDGKLHIVFCDVGQGDAIFIKTPEGKSMLFDGGPDDSVMQCASEQLPFWSRTIDTLIMSHPHADHFMGFLSVLQKYKVNWFLTEKLTNTTYGFKRLQEDIKMYHIFTKYLYKGDIMTLGSNMQVRVLAPTKDLLSRTSPEGSVGDTKEFASLLLLITYGKFSVLLTGDSQAAELNDAVRQIGRITVLQVSHHGSATGISQDFVKRVSPRLGVISVGMKNRYGFPTLATLTALRINHVPVLRTDQHSTIRIKTNGKTWTVN